jgi:hypothetical protein
MAADLDLTTWCEVAPRFEISIVKFFANLPFGDHLDPCKNTKFPGQHVVGICKEDIHIVKGFATKHIPYKLQEIVPWLHPVDRQIPPLSFNELAFPKQNTTAIVTKSLNCIETLDFGGSSNYFETVTIDYISWNDLDFGSEDGLFGDQKIKI